MKIRTAVQQDARVLSTLCADVQRLHAAHYPWLFKQPESDDFAFDFFIQMLAEPAVTAYLAEVEQDPAGYLLCELMERPENDFTFALRALHVEHVGVRPAAQRRGIGAALMAQVENLARELGVRRIQLESWSFNTGAHGFFESLGYQKFNHRFWKDIQT